MHTRTAYLVERLKECAARGLYRAQAAAELAIPQHRINQIEYRHGRIFQLDGRGKWRDSQPERSADMAAMFKGGAILEEIGQKHGITRERVRQILKARFGIDARHGGQRVRAKRKQIDKQAKRDVRALEKHGCTYAQYAQLRNMKKPTGAFTCQRNNAHQRGIGWEMNLWQWWTIWQESGHWAERGRGRGYVMCRRNDSGPYATWNVYIATGVQNVQDYLTRVGRVPREPGAPRKLTPAQLERRRFNIRQYYYRRKFRDAGIPAEQIPVLVAAHCPPLVAEAA